MGIHRNTRETGEWIGDEVNAAPDPGTLGMTDGWTNRQATFLQSVTLCAIRQSDKHNKSERGQTWIDGCRQKRVGR